MTARKTNPTAAEALGDKIPFTFDGVSYLVNPTSEWEYDTLVAYEEGRIAGFLKAVLGEKQHETFRATKPKIADVNRFVEAIQKALGISGN